MLATQALCIMKVPTKTLCIFHNFFSGDLPRPIIREAGLALKILFNYNQISNLLYFYFHFPPFVCGLMASTHPLLRHLLICAYTVIPLAKLLGELGFKPRFDDCACIKRRPFLRCRLTDIRCLRLPMASRPVFL